jgi:hypothetical protein
MADNVNITAGSGTVIATDQVGTDHYQKVKLVDGTADSSTVIAVDVGAKANALRIAPANDITDATYIGDIKFGEALPAGTNEIGKLAAGTAAIGKLAANSGVDIGDVDVTSIVPGTGATNLGKAEDAVHGSGDVGVMVLTVRDNAPSTATAAEGDYVPLLTNATGQLYVIDPTGNALITTGNASLATIAGDTTNIETAVQIMDDWDAVHSSAASSDGPQVMGAYDSTKPTAVSDGEAVRLLTDSYGRLLSGVEPQRFQAVYDSSNATAEAEVVHASAVSTVIVVQSYVISSDVEGWIKLQDEDSVALTGKFWLKAGGGVAITLPENAPIVLGVNKDLEVICEAAGDVSVSVTGYTIPG